MSLKRKTASVLVIVAPLLLILSVLWEAPGHVDNALAWKKFLKEYATEIRSATFMLCAVLLVWAIALFTANRHQRCAPVSIIDQPESKAGSIRTETELKLQFVEDTPPYLQTDYHRHVLSSGREISSGMIEGWMHRVSVKNVGKKPAKNVRVKLAKLDPSDLQCLPVTLRRMHDNSPPFAESFDLNPDDDPVVVDVVYRRPYDDYFQVQHTVVGAPRDLNGQNYELEISVSADNALTERQKFSLFLDQNRFSKFLRQHKNRHTQ